MANVLRTCFVTREKKLKSQLLRIVYDKKTDLVQLDPKQNLEGRGVYLFPHQTIVLSEKMPLNKLKHALKLKRDLTPEEKAALINT